MKVKSINTECTSENLQQTAVVTVTSKPIRKDIKLSDSQDELNVEIIKNDYSIRDITSNTNVKSTLMLSKISDDLYTIVDADDDLNSLLDLSSDQPNIQEQYTKNVSQTKQILTNDYTDNSTLLQNKLQDEISVLSLHDEAEIEGSTVKNISTTHGVTEEFISDTLALVEVVDVMKSNEVTAYKDINLETDSASLFHENSNVNDIGSAEKEVNKENKDQVASDHQTFKTNIPIISTDHFHRNVQDLSNSKSENTEKINENIVHVNNYASIGNENNTKINSKEREKYVKCVSDEENASNTKTINNLTQSSQTSDLENVNPIDSSPASTVNVLKLKNKVLNFSQIDDLLDTWRLPVKKCSFNIKSFSLNKHVNKLNAIINDMDDVDTAGSEVVSSRQSGVKCSSSDISSGDGKPHEKSLNLSNWSLLSDDEMPFFTGETDGGNSRDRLSSYSATRCPIKIKTKKRPANIIENDPSDSSTTNSSRHSSNKIQKVAHIGAPQLLVIDMKDVTNSEEGLGVCDPSLKFSFTFNQKSKPKLICDNFGNQNVKGNITEQSVEENGLSVQSTHQEQDADDDIAEDCEGDIGIDGDGEAPKTAAFPAANSSATLGRGNTNCEPLPKKTRKYKAGRNDKETVHYIGKIYVHRKEYRVYHANVKGQVDKFLMEQYYALYTCHLCSKILGCENDVKKHIRCHFLDLNKYPCNICNRQHMSIQDLIKHMHTHDDSKEHVCRLCSTYYKKDSAYKLHMVRYHRMNKYICKVCSGSYERLSEATAHTKTHSTGTECIPCDKEFETERSLSSHLETHVEKISFDCSICDREFDHNFSLERHEKSHIGEKPFRCHCGKSFYLRSNLYFHLTKHKNNDRPYICPLCAVVTSNKAMFALHVKNKHTEKLFCLCCKRDDFQTKLELSTHLKSHAAHGWSSTKVHSFDLFTSVQLSDVLEDGQPDWTKNTWELKDAAGDVHAFNSTNYLTGNEQDYLELEANLNVEPLAGIRW